MLQVKLFAIILFFFTSQKESAMGAGPKISSIPLQKQQKKKNPLPKLRKWRERNTGFIKAKHPTTGKIGFWEIDKQGWSLEYTLFIGEINKKEKSVQLLNFRREIVEKTPYPDIEIVSGTLFLQKT